MINIDSTAQEIVQHAQIGPAANGERGRVVNSLSLHYEHLVKELIRKLLIRSTQEAQKQIAQELAQFGALLPDTLKPQADMTIARINHILSSVYK